MGRQWETVYAGRRTSLDRALKEVKRGSKVFLGTACAEPQYQVQGLIDRADILSDVQLLHFVTLGDAPYTAARFDNRFRHNAFFVGPNSRDAINEARADYTPVFISEIPGLFREGIVPLDVALIQTTPPDRHGFVSLGISVDIVRAADESARVVIAQVNRHMPRTLGDTFLSVEKIAWWRWPTPFTRRTRAGGSVRFSRNASRGTRSERALPGPRPICSRETGPCFGPSQNADPTSGRHRTAG